MHSKFNSLKRFTLVLGLFTSSAALASTEISGYYWHEHVLGPSPDIFEKGLKVSHTKDFTEGSELSLGLAYIHYDGFTLNLDDPSKHNIKITCQGAKLFSRYAAPFYKVSSIEVFGSLKADLRLNCMRSFPSNQEVGLTAEFMVQPAIGIKKSWSIDQTSIQAQLSVPLVTKTLYHKTWLTSKTGYLSKITVYPGQHDLGYFLETSVQAKSANSTVKNKPGAYLYQPKITEVQLGLIKSF